MSRVLVNGIYQALREAGQKYGVGHYGAFAMNAMRLEKGYRAWGQDLSTERTPFESGLDRFVRLDGPDFTGQTALRRAADKPAEFRMELLEIEGEGPDPFALHPVLCDGRAVGLVTSGAYGHRTMKKLALAYLKPALVPEDAPLTVEICGEACAACILAAAPWDPNNRRLRDATEITT